MTKSLKSLLAVIALAVASLILAVSPAPAADFEFNDISKGDLEKIVGEFSANFAFTSVSGASSLGRIFGFELGVIGGLTQTPEIEKIAKQQDPGAQADQVPHGALIGALSIPFGLTVEANIIPETDFGGLKFNSTGLAVKWTLTESVLADLPLSLAVRAHYMKTDLSFTETVASGGPPVKTDFEYSSTTSGVQVLASKSFLLVEPYVGLGILSGDGELTARGSSTVFGGDLTGRTSADAQDSGFQFLVGAELKLVIFKLGLEYSNHLNTDRLSAKLAFYF